VSGPDKTSAATLDAVRDAVLGVLNKRNRAHISTPPQACSSARDDANQTYGSRGDASLRQPTNNIL
jgi:hypothetical protein